MNILQIVPQFPWPTSDGGKIGIASISREYSRAGHRVHMFAIVNEDISAERRAAALDHCASLEIVRADTRNSPVNIAASLFSSLPLFVWKFQREHVRRALHAYARRQHIDVIHADHSSTALLALELAAELDVPVGLRMHNVEYVIWQRYAERFAAWRPERWYLQLQARRLQQLEADVFGRMDVNFAITEQDLARARAMAPEGSYILAPAGVDLAEWNPDPSVARNPHSCVLATTFSWVHNVEAARWLIDEVMPLVRQAVPQAHLTLIGKNPPEQFLRRAGEHLTVTGFVDRVQPWLERAAVCCAPLFVGGGIRIKILEAMAMRLPVVATAISAEGIHATENDGLFRAESASAFADAIVALLRVPDFRVQSGAAAREFVAREFTWASNVGKMQDAFARLLADSN